MAKRQFRLFGTIINDDSERYSADDVTPSQVNAFLRTCSEEDEIEIAINSPGGSVTAGLAIANMFKSAKQAVTSRVYGIAASMASVVACAADELHMFRSSYMMVHNPWGVMIGDSDAMRQTADVLDSMKSACADLYASKFPTLKKEDLAKLMSDESWMLGSDLASFGLAATIEDDPVEMAALLTGPVMFAKIPDGAKRFYSGDPKMSKLPAGTPPASPEILALSQRAETLQADLTAAQARAVRAETALVSANSALSTAQAAAASAETQRRDHQARADRLASELEQTHTAHAAVLAERDGKIIVLTANASALEARIASMTLNALKTPFDAVATTWEGALKECGSYEAAKAKYPQLAEAYRAKNAGK